MANILRQRMKRWVLVALAVMGLDLSMCLGFDLCELRAQPAGVNLEGRSDRFTAQLQGNVATVDETTWKIDYSRRTLERAEQTSHATDSFNVKGNILWRKTFDEDGLQESHTIYQYDEKGQKRVSTTYSRTGERALQTLYAYTVDGFLARMRFTDADATTISTTEVGIADFWTETVEMYKDGEKVSTIYHYDNEIRLDRVSRNDGHISTEMRYRYVVGKLPSRGTYTTSDGRKYSMTYEYETDEAGNWTRMVTYVDGRATEERVRTITYHNATN